MSSAASFAPAAQKNVAGFAEVHCYRSGGGATFREAGDYIIKIFFYSRVPLFYRSALQSLLAARMPSRIWIRVIGAKKSRNMFI